MKKSLKSVCKLNTYKQIDAATIMDLIEESTDIALLPSSKNYNIYTSLEKGKSLMSNGEVITLGKARYANIKYYKGNFISSNNVIIESKDTSFLRTKYLYYYLYFTQKNYYVEGATYPKFDQNLFNNSIIDIPTIQQQDKTIILLDYLFNFIEQESIYVEKFEELIKSRFIEMFGDPIYNSKQWKIKYISEIGSLKNGMNFSNEKNKIDIKCLGVGDFKNHSVINTSDLSYISLDELPNNEYLLKNNDIIFVRSNGNKNLVGRCVTIFPNEENITFSGFCIRLRISDKSINTQYLLRLLKDEGVKEQLRGRGANIQNLNQQILSKLQVPVPPIELQNKFAEFVQLIDKLKFIAQKRIDLYTELLNKKMDEYFN